MLLLFVEYYLNGLEVYKTHIFFVLFYSFAYLALNWYVTTHIRQIYAVMTWKDNMTYVWAGVAFLVSIVTYFILVAWGKAKSGIYREDDEKRGLRQGGHVSSDRY